MKADDEQSKAQYKVYYNQVPVADKTKVVLPTNTEPLQYAQAGTTTTAVDNFWCTPQ